MPDELTRLLNSAVDEVGRLTDSLKSGRLNADTWEAETAKALTGYHMAAYMAGQDSDELGPKQRRRLADTVGEQVDYLNNFADEIAATGWKDAYAARAAMYAAAIKKSFWEGRAKGLPLPGYPTQGTQCLSNCRCYWELVILDEENDDIDAYWRRGKTDSCSTCVERESAWSPYKIRGGEGE